MNELINFKEQHKRMKTGLAAEIGAKGGRAKKGSKHISTWIQEVLEDESLQAKYLEGVEYKELDGKTPPIKAIVRVAVIKSVQGDQRWAEWLAKYGYGAKLDITSDGEQLDGLTINVTNIDARLAELVTGRQAGSDKSLRSGEPAPSQD